MADISVSFSKTLSLETLETEVAAFENLQGPLKALDRTDSKSIAIYKLGRRPTPTVKLMLAGPVPTGFTKVCEGPVWIVSQKQNVMAIRKNPA
jgi:hypothetical protein